MEGLSPFWALVATLSLVLHQLSFVEATRFSIRWYAPFLADSGFGVEATQFIESIDANKDLFGDASIQARQFAEQAAFESLSAPLIRALDYRTWTRSNCLIVVCHATPPFWVPSDFPSWDYAAPCPPRDANFKIGRVMYETDSVPGAWISKLLKMDELWVPTRFALQQFEGAGIPSMKLRVVPEPFNTDVFHPDRCPKNMKQDGKFTFLAVFKWEERKGWYELLKAFFDEFEQDENINLLIKTSAFHLPESETPKSMAAKMFPQIERDERIVFQVGRIAENKLIQDFYCKADALLAPSYGEGWGRVPAEAASMQIPVIFTNYSGTTEFLNEDNAFPVAVDRMVPALDAGHLWAKPSISSLRHQMRFVLEHPNEAAIRAKKGRQTILSHYSLSQVGKLVYEALQAAPCISSSNNEEL